MGSLGFFAPGFPTSGEAVFMSGPARFPKQNNRFPHEGEGFIRQKKILLTCNAQFYTEENIHSFEINDFQNKSRCRE
jgi:hypothetical protein